MSNQTTPSGDSDRIEPEKPEVKRCSLEKHVEGLNEPQNIQEEYDKAYEEVVLGGSRFYNTDSPY